MLTATCLAYRVRHGADGAARRTIRSPSRPAMGHNFFFAYSVVIGMKVPWQIALGGVAMRRSRVHPHRRHWPARTADHRNPRVAQITRLPAGIGLLIATIGPAMGRFDRRLRRERWSRSAICTAGRSLLALFGADVDGDAHGAAGARRVSVGHPRQHDCRRWRSAWCQYPGHCRPPAVDPADPAASSTSPALSRPA